MPVAAKFPPSASATAALIAGAVVIASHDPALRPLVPAGAAELSRRLLVAAGRPGWVRATRVKVVRVALRQTERLVLPGILRHYLVRKLALEAAVRGACSGVNGCQQVVVLGAGLDTLAGRLHRGHPEVRWLEVDRPGALRAKAAALPDAGGNLRFVPADLAVDDLWAALTGAGLWDPTRPTVFLAEGLFMYLPFTRVEELLAEGASRMRAPGRWAFTFFERGADGRIGFRRSSPLVDQWLRRRGEPFRWAASEDEVRAMLARHGWAVREFWRAAEFRERFLRPVGLGRATLAEGEVVCVAERIP